MWWLNSRRLVRSTISQPEAGNRSSCAKTQTCADFSLKMVNFASRLWPAFLQDDNWSSSSKLMTVNNVVCSLSGFANIWKRTPIWTGKSFLVYVNKESCANPHIVHELAKSDCLMRILGWWCHWSIFFLKTTLAIIHYINFNDNQFLLLSNLTMFMWTTCGSSRTVLHSHSKCQDGNFARTIWGYAYPLQRYCGHQNHAIGSN